MLPGIVEIRADSELVFLAISSERFIIFETFTPAAGSNSFRVTTGPWLTFLIFPSTPKSKRIFSRNSGSLLSLLFEFFVSVFVRMFNKSIDGIWNLGFPADLFVSVLINGRSSCIKFFISSCGMYSLIISFLFV